MKKLEQSNDISEFCREVLETVDASVVAVDGDGKANEQRLGFLHRFQANQLCFPLLFIY